MTSFKSKNTLITSTVMTSGRFRAPANALISSMVENFSKFCDDYIDDVVSSFPVNDAKSGSIKAICESFVLDSLIEFYPTILKLSDFFSKSDLDIEKVLASKDGLKLIEGNKDYELFKELYFDPLLALIEKKRLIDDNFVPLTTNRFIPSFSISTVRNWIDRVKSKGGMKGVLDSIRTEQFAHFATDKDLSDNDLSVLTSVGMENCLDSEFSKLLKDCETLITNWDDNHPTDGLSLLTALSSISSSRLDTPLLGFESDLSFWDAQASVLPLIPTTNAISASFGVKGDSHSELAYQSFKGWDSGLNFESTKHSNKVSGLSVGDYLGKLLFTIAHNNRRGMNLFNHISLPLCGFVAYPLIHECTRREIRNYYPSIKLNTLEVIEIWAKSRQNRLVSEFESELATAVTTDKIALPEAAKRKWLDGADLNVGDLYSKLTARRGTYERQLVIPNLPCNLSVSGLELDVVKKGKITLRSNVPFIDYPSVPTAFGASTDDGIIVRSPMFKGRIIDDFAVDDALKLIVNKYDNDDASSTDITLDFSFSAIVSALKKDLRVVGKLRPLIAVPGGDVHIRDVVNSGDCNFNPTFDTTLIERIPARDRLLGFEGSLTSQTINVEDTIYRTDCYRSGLFEGRLISDPSQLSQNVMIVSFVRNLLATYEEQGINKVCESFEYKPVFSNMSYRKRLAAMDSLFTPVVSNISRIKRLIAHPYSTVFLRDFDLDLSHFRLIQEEQVLINAQLSNEISECVRHEVKNFVESGLLPSNGISEVVKPILNGTFTKESHSRLRGGKNLPLVANLLTLAFGGTARTINIYNFIYAMKFLDAVIEQENN